MTEVQAGGGIFSDMLYRESFGVEHPYAMTILATVTSRPDPKRIICDAGKKTMTGDAAMPEPILLDEFCRRLTTTLSAACSPGWV